MMTLYVIKLSFGWSLQLTAFRGDKIWIIGFLCVIVCVYVRGSVRRRKDRPAPRRRSAVPCLGVLAQSSSTPRRCRSARRRGRLWEGKELWPDLQSKMRRMKTKEKQGQYEKSWLELRVFSPPIVELFKLHLLELIQAHKSRDTQNLSASF